jgi:hypothetical protein
MALTQRSYAGYAYSDGDQDGDDAEFDNDEEDYAQFTPAIPAKRLLPWEIEYESLESDKLREIVNKDVDHVAGIFGVEVRQIAFREQIIDSQGIYAARNRSGTP